MMVLFLNPNSQKWFYSRTLLTRNLKKDMALYLQMLEQPEWSNDHILKFGTQESFVNSCYIHVLALKGKTTEHYLHILVRRMKHLLPALIIQHIEISRWGNSILLPDFGKVIKE
jgi:hypothetical protein